MVVNIRIGIVDDDALVRAGLRMMLASDSITIVGEAADGDEALALVSRERPDLLLLDIRMPNKDGIAVTRALRKQGDTTRVLVLTTFDTDELVIAALRNGANGFLLKDTEPADIVAAIHQTMQGQPALSPAATARLIAAVRDAPDDSVHRARTLLDTLTDRERDVALAIAKGRTNQQIAQELYISLTTVKTHISALFTKLYVTNRVEIARAIYDARVNDL